MTGILRVCAKCKKKRELKEFIGISSSCRACQRSSLLKDKPLFRPLQIYSGDNYHEDIPLLWVAHQRKPFKLLKSKTSDEFVQELERLSSTFEMTISEDKNKEYKDRGPLSLIFSVNDGWSLEAQCEFFPWATKRNILRMTVGYFHMIRYQDIGVCKVCVLENSKSLLDHVCSYGVLKPVGKVFNGDLSGDEYLYSISNTKYATSRRQHGVP